MQVGRVVWHMAWQVRQARPAWRGVWRVAWRDVAWRGVERRGETRRAAQYGISSASSGPKKLWRCSGGRVLFSTCTPLAWSVMPVSPRLFIVLL